MPRACSALLLVFILVAVGLPPAGGADLSAQGPGRISFIPQWAPQAQFAGYYAAFEKGFYKALGLDVNIMRGGPGKSPAEMLAKGEADFGTMFLSAGIEAKASGVPLVNIAQMVRKSTFLLVTRKSSGINAPRDMQGKKMGVWGGELRLQPAAFLRKHGVSVIEVPQSYSINLFLRGGVDIASAMSYNEYHMILNAGVEPDDLTVFRLADYGINFPEDGIYCLEKKFRKDPEMCSRFVQASVQGWKYAFEHPEVALDIVMKYVNEANIATNRCNQKWMLERLRDAVFPSGVDGPAGELPRSDYIAVAEEMKADGLIGSFPSYSDFFVNCAIADEK